MMKKDKNDKSESDFTLFRGRIHSPAELAAGWLASATYPVPDENDGTGASLAGPHGGREREQASDSKVKVANDYGQVTRTSEEMGMDDGRKRREDGQDETQSSGDTEGDDRGDEGDDDKRGDRVGIMNTKNTINGTRVLRNSGTDTAPNGDKDDQGAGETQSEVDRLEAIWRHARQRGVPGNTDWLVELFGTTHRHSPFLDDKEGDREVGEVAASLIGQDDVLTGHAADRWSEVAALAVLTPPEDKNANQWSYLRFILTLDSNGRVWRGAKGQELIGYTQEQRAAVLSLLLDPTECYQPGESLTKFFSPWFPQQEATTSAPRERPQPGGHFIDAPVAPPALVFPRNDVRVENQLGSHFTDTHVRNDPHTLAKIRRFPLRTVLHSLFSEGEHANYEIEAHFQGVAEAESGTVRIALHISRRDQAETVRIERNKSFNDNSHSTEPVALIFAVLQPTSETVTEGREACFIVRPIYAHDIPPELTDRWRPSLSKPYSRG